MCTLLDEPTAVMFGISDDDAELAAAFRKKSQFVFERPLSAEVNPRNPQACIRAHSERTETQFLLPGFYSGHHPEKSMQEGWCNSVNISEGATALSRLVPLRCGRERQRPAHTAHSTLFRRIDDLRV
jgi:hypothetical protein